MFDPYPVFCLSALDDLKTLRRGTVSADLTEREGVADEVVKQKLIGRDYEGAREALMDQSALNLERVQPQVAHYIRLVSALTIAQRRRLGPPNSP